MYHLRRDRRCGAGGSFDKLRMTGCPLVGVRPGEPAGDPFATRWRASQWVMNKVLNACIADCNANRDARSGREDRQTPGK
jgi:hypothetical protein